MKPIPRNVVLLWLSLLLLTVLVGCGGQPALFTAQDADTLSAATSLSGRLKAHVVKLSDDIGNRSVGAYDHLNQAADYIEARFEAQGYAVHRQTFRAWGREVSNIVADKPGRDPSLPLVLVGAHYDTYFAPGADDNASGVAAVLELAGRLSTKTTAGPVRFVAFVNEEDPWWGTDKMGSLVCARAAKAAGEELRVMLNLDMVGYYPGGRHYLRLGANQKSAATGEQVKQLLRDRTTFAIRDIPQSDPSIRWSDHWAFWHEGYQALCLAAPGWDHDENIHGPDDTWEKLHYPNMAEVVRGLDAAVCGLWEGQAVTPIIAYWPGVFAEAN